jgi:hypothetical protein
MNFDQLLSAYELKLAAAIRAAKRVLAIARRNHVENTIVPSNRVKEIRETGYGTSVMTMYFKKVLPCDPVGQGGMVGACARFTASRTFGLIDRRHAAALRLSTRLHGRSRESEVRSGDMEQKQM